MLTVAAWLKDGIPDTTGARLSVTEELSILDIRHRLQTIEMGTQDAQDIVQILKDRGLLEKPASPSTDPGKESLAAFLERSWTFDESPYVKERQAYGHRIGKSWCKACLSYTKHWREAFPATKLEDLTTQDITRFLMKLKKSGLSSSTCNSILLTARTPFQWAVKAGILARDPFGPVRTFAGDAKVRGILDPDEVTEILKRSYWKDERSWTASLVAATTGLRLGEIRALRVEDVGPDRLTIRHSYSDADGLKGTKTGKIRQAPLIPAVRRALMKLAATNPHGPKGFIFYGYIHNKPLDGMKISRDLKLAFIEMRTKGLTGQEHEQESLKADSEWRTRILTFHSWRHFYCARLADSIDPRKVKIATGHATAAMFEHYADHAKTGDLEDVAKAVSAMFAPVTENLQAEHA